MKTNTNQRKAIVLAFIGGVCASCLFLTLSWYTHQQFRINEDSFSSELVRQQSDNLHQLVQGPPTIESILDLEGMESNWVRLLALDKLLVSAAVDELVNYFTDSRSLSNKPLQRSIQKQILRRIALTDPEIALEQIETIARFRRDEFRTVVFIEWSNYDLRGLIEYARDIDLSIRDLVYRVIINWRLELTEGQLQAIGSELNFGASIDKIISDVKMMYNLYDPQTQWEAFIEDAIADSDQSEVLITVAFAWMEQEGIEVLDSILHSMPRGRGRSKVLGELLLELTTTNGTEAFQRLIDNYDPTLQNFANRLVDKWTSVNPEAAFAAITELQLPALKRTLLDTALTTWARTDPTSFKDYSSSIPQEYRELHDQAAMRLAILEEPQTAAQRLFGDEQLGSVTHARALVSSWSIQDPMAAFEWALTNPNIETWRDELVRDTFWSLSAIELDDAMSLVLNLPVSEDMVGYEAYIIAAWSKRDVKKAQTLLSKTRRGATRLAAYQSVGSALVDMGEYESFVELSQDLTGSDRKSYFEAIAEPLVWNYLEDAYTIFERTSSSVLKSILAKRLYVYSQADKAGKLSKQQKERLNAFLTDVDREELSDEIALMGTLDFLFE